MTKKSVTKKTTTLFPAIRCRMGEWIYYATSLSFADVAEWIKQTEEIYTSKRLSDWIQRQLDNAHANRIADYLLQEDERFFNAIVVGVYQGSPKWAPLRIDVKPQSGLSPLTDDQEVEFQRSVGVLQLTGNERLFPIDGQHRVAGIKKAVKANSQLSTDEVCALFVAHEASQKGKERTRRLFATLNKTAKKVTTADIVALDEDDAFAVIARRMVDDFDLLQQGKVVSLKGGSALGPADTSSLTSIVGLYELAQDLYQVLFDQAHLQPAAFKRARPTEETLDTAYTRFCEYWKTLVKEIPEYKAVFTGPVEKRTEPGYYRTPERSHLLFRPVGQRAFAGAVRILVTRNIEMTEAIRRLSKTDLWLTSQQWENILWNPITRSVISKNKRFAETLLLRAIGEKGRDPTSDRKLTAFIREIESHK